MKQRRALQGIKFNVPSEVLSGEPDKVGPEVTELESLILAAIPHTRKYISARCKALLREPVTTNGMLMVSPEGLWAAEPSFRKWVRDKLEAIKSLPGMNIDRAVYSIRDYGHPTYGWIHFDASKSKPYAPQATIEPEPEIWDLTHGDE